MQRRQRIALCLVLLMSCLHAGNMAGYVLCRLSVSSDTTLRDCGCDIWLNGSQATAEATGDFHAESFKNISLESTTPQPAVLLQLPESAHTGCHAAYLLILPDRPGDVLFRPPATC